MTRNKLFIILMFLVGNASAQQKTNNYDVIVYGGTSAGVIAAYTAKQMGKSVLLIEPGIRVGGLTTGGLGYTDIGNKYAIKGLSLDFYRRVGQHYGNFEQWIFEPHVAEDVFLAYLKKENIPVLYTYRIVSAKKDKGNIVSITLESSDHPSLKTNKTISGKMFIDCSYEGDLMAKAGVSYTVGREDNKQYNETYNGIQLRDKHQFPEGVDSYKTPGKPESGLLWGVSNDPLLPNGTGNKMVQTYNIRVCLTKNKANMIPITEPPDYKAERYELLLRLLEKRPVKRLNELMTLSQMPNDKTDINNNGAFSTDMIGWSWEYPEGDYNKRASIFKAHENYTKGFFYFIGHDPRVPLFLQIEMLQYGYPKDEYVNSDHFTTQMYVREARRMVGEYIMTQANCEAKEIVTDGVGMAAYTMDSHNAERIVVNGVVKNEGDVQIGGFGPYPISYRSIVPKSAECGNLLVPVCLSASHIAYGSIRMEPVFMMLGQSAAVAAGLAIDGKTNVQKIDVKKLQLLLKTNPLADSSTPEILMDNDDLNGIIPKGKWTRHANAPGCYGPSVLIDSANDKTGDFVRFTPAIKKEGLYNVYTYVAKPLGSSSQITLLISDGTQQKNVVINMKDIVVKGQTDGEWVSLGKYHFTTGNKGSITVTGKKADGTVLADAVLFVPERK
ncbi:MAG TPA: FAD-dependent oxidoreductase [Mucilaginibacter sp.]